MAKAVIGDYVKVQQGGLGKKPWRGRVRRFSETGMALIEWSYCGDLPTDVCTWVFAHKLRLVNLLGRESHA